VPTTRYPAVDGAGNDPLPATPQRKARLLR
jgi:hypothetical protein